jgi:hypothetical protein
VTCPRCRRRADPVQVEVVPSSGLKIHLRYWHECRCGHRYATDEYINPWAGAGVRA